ncbi:PREDICTED: protein TORNADO 2 isoform X1 [Theobroma cacao]|uniref:Protein TORNADO 2 isoform X1 n=1 Tax=Theobroma cacao TaxID=3641 RepID=A0AB32VE09_THECC|nr:PREDICTED: protein TORNADO 2 isoform X1 [Theobroma cacao]
MIVNIFFIIFARIFLQSKLFHFLFIIRSHSQATKPSPERSSQNPVTKMAASNTIVGTINFITLLLSIPIIGAGIWLANEPDNSCVKILQWPLIILGISISVVALLGFVGGCWRITWLLIVYLVAMFILIVLFACLVVLIYLVTKKGSGHPAPGRTYLEHDLDDFSGWLRRKVASPYKWNRIRACLNSTDMCSELNQRYRIAQDFFNARLTSIQYGCCMPPAECGYTYINPTYWLTPNNTAASMDCLQWSNDQMQLCFHCDSCKAGLLANLTKEWRSVDIILLITLVVLICVYLIGFCCALRKSKPGDGDTSPRRNKENT